MKRSRLLSLAVAASIAAASQGCYGSFALTRKVYDVNGSVGDKWVRTLVFWAFVIIPVYGVCAFVDAIVFNLIEFWTGDKVLSSVEHDDGTRTELARLDADTVRMRRYQGDTLLDELHLVRAGEGAALARRADGTVLSQVETLADGTLVTREPGSGTVRMLTAEKVLALAFDAREDGVGLSQAVDAVRGGTAGATASLASR